MRCRRSLAELGGISVSLILSSPLQCGRPDPVNLAVVDDKMDQRNACINKGADKWRSWTVNRGPSCVAIVAPTRHPIIALSNTGVASPHIQCSASVIFNCVALVAIVALSCCQYIRRSYPSTRPYHHVDEHKSKHTVWICSTSLEVSTRSRQYPTIARSAKLA